MENSGASGENDLPMSTEESRPLALLIPGLDGTGKLFYKQVPPLSARYRVRAWQFQPGGKSDFPGLVEELGRATVSESPGSILLIAESFGGSVALQFALRFPARLRQLVLVNAFSYYRHRTRIGLACHVAPLLNMKGARGIKNLVVDRILAREGILKEDRRKYSEIVRLVDLPGYCRRLELIQQVDLRARLKNISMPTLIFASGRDKLVPSIPEARYMASVMPRAQVHEFPRAGHALLLTPGFNLADYV